MSEWREFEFGGIAEIQTGPFGSQLVKDEYIDGGIPVITVENIKDFQVESFTYPSVTREKSTELSRYSVQEGDVLFSRVGSVDLSALVKKEQDGWIISSRMLRARLNDFGNARFVAYFLQQSKVRRYINAIAVGATMPSINTSILKSIPIRLPQLETQIAIAEVLSSLDDKIDLLKRQNKTLEGMAEALFRQWFIEEAQDDWGEVEIKELFNVKIGRTPPRKQTEWFESTESAQNWPWFSIKDMAHCGTFISHSSEFISSEGQEKFKIPIIPPFSVVLSFKLTVGRVAITQRPMLSNEAIAHFISRSRDTSDLVLYCFLKSLNFDSLGSTSSIAQAVNSSTIRNIRMPKFPQSLCQRFDDTCSIWFDRIRENQHLIDVCEKQRDTLLPKLMSGEVRVNLD